MKNSKEYPYTFDDWRGRKRPRYGNIVDPVDDTTGNFLTATDVRQTPETLTANWLSYPCKGMVAVTGADIANKTSTGVFSSNSLQIQINWRAHSGFGGAPPGNSTHQLYNHLIFGKEFLRIETDKSSFMNQSLDESTARRLVDPPLGSLSMGVPQMMNSTGGSLSVGGALAPLRNRGVSAIGSRLV